MKHSESVSQVNRLVQRKLTCITVVVVPHIIFCNLQTSCITGLAKISEKFVVRIKCITWIGRAQKAKERISQFKFQFMNLLRMLSMTMSN